MQPIILFRNLNNKEYKEEENIALQYFEVKNLRTQIPENSLVIGRYSVIPLYKEVEDDIKNLNSKLINSFQEHNWISEFHYYEDLKDFTPKTWIGFNQFISAEDKDGPFVVKGATNSKKFNWNKSMFASTKKDALNIAYSLTDDNLIQEQEIIFRKFEQLKILEYGINGLPFANEFRFFYYKENLLSYGFYWSIADDPSLAKMDEKGLNFAQNLAKIVSKKTNFYTLDIAQKENGEWILIEINDGQMSGLSDNSADQLYKNLKEVLQK